MKGIYIGVGSNLDPGQNVKEALRLLKEHVRIVGISTFYESEPLDRPDQPAFYNGVIEIETDLFPRPLKFEVLRSIEAELGRRRTADKSAARTIDLDVIIYGDLVISEDDLKIPDPDIIERAFLSVPLFELAPDLELPGSGTSLKEICNSLESQEMKPLRTYTQELIEAFL
ncbi:MAG: 2-amino-4-hydroxy-6-hydroxymethyldihydropteridine diphosphokinase [Planctomycetota bacterium]|jgi:2-amino-4-hydroxy-6-hydroxymethyldihydropteridine diphosphokinase